MYKFKIGDRVMHEKFGVGTVLIHDLKMGLCPYLVRYDCENINLGDVAKGSRIHEVNGIAVDSSRRYSWCAEASLKEVKAKSSDRKPENQKPAKYNYRFIHEKELRLVAPPLRPRDRRVVIEITDDGAEAKYIVGKMVEKTASVKRYKDDKPDDGKAAGYAVDKLFALTDRKRDRVLLDELMSECKKQKDAVENINRIFRDLFDIED